MTPTKITCFLIKKKMHKSNWIKINGTYYRKDTIIGFSVLNECYSENQRILWFETLRGEHKIRATQEEIDKIKKELNIK